MCGTRNAELVRSPGADHVVDYSREDFTRAGRRYDLVFDLVGNRSLTDCGRALASGGTLVLAGGGVSEGGSLVGPMALLAPAAWPRPWTAPTRCTRCPRPSGTWARRWSSRCGRPGSGSGPGCGSRAGCGYVRGRVIASAARRMPSVNSSAVAADSGSKSHWIIRPLSSAW